MKISLISQLPTISKELLTLVSSNVKLFPTLFNILYETMYHHITAATHTNTHTAEDPYSSGSYDYCLMGCSAI